MREIFKSGLLATVVFTAGSVHADGAKPLDALEHCQATLDKELRLACYDQAVDVLVRRTADNDVVVMDRTEVRAARRGLFGFVLPKLSFLNGRPGNRDDAEDVTRLETTIVSAKPFGYGLWTMVLAQGGTWQTAEAKENLEPEPGQTIVIERGLLGSYMAKIGRTRQNRVRRIG